MEAEHEKAMSDVLANASKNLEDLEKKHFETINLMKDTEEKARTESEQRVKLEADLIQLQEKIKKLEAECVHSIGEAWKMANGRENRRANMRPGVKLKIRFRGFTIGASETDGRLP
jgi:hypothetical protein